MRIALAAAPRTGGSRRGRLLAPQAAYNELMDIDKHYQRKEHPLFTFLEHRGMPGPPKVMRAKHERRDPAEGTRRRDGRTGRRRPECQRVARPLASPAVDLEEMIYKEEPSFCRWPAEPYREESGEIWTPSPVRLLPGGAPPGDRSPRPPSSDVPGDSMAEASRAGVTFAPGQGGAKVAPDGRPFSASGRGSWRPLGSGAIVLPTGSAPPSST